jgi:hypothetical protein
MSIEIRPAVDADFVRFFGDMPPAFRACRAVAWAGVDGDDVLGIGGVLYHADGGVTGFLNVSDEGRKHAVTLHRAALRALGEWRSMGCRRLAVTIDRQIPRAEAWARRLGFEPLHDADGIWVLRG